MRKIQVERMNKINLLLEMMGDSGRGFFKSRNGRARFIELKTTVKFIDHYTQITLSIPSGEDWHYGISFGGTLKALIKDFKEYIITGKHCNGKHGYGGLYSLQWGYPLKDQSKIIDFAKCIGYLKDDSISFSEYVEDIYITDGWMLCDTLKKDIEMKLKEDTLLCEPRKVIKVTKKAKATKVERSGDLIIL